MIVPSCEKDRILLKITRRIAFFIVVAIVGVISAPAAVFADQVPDDRFGLGGDCFIARDLHIPWAYDWGNGKDYFPNEQEYGCMETGRKTFFTVGKLDSDGNYNLPSLEAMYLDGDNSDYNRLKELLQNYIGKGPQASYLFIKKYAQDYPGMIYAVGNEPDLLPLISPANYAELYYIYYSRIKKYDATAKMMIGGLGSVYPETTTDQNDWYSWPRQFREEYRNKYGVYPPVDYWSFHIYAWDTTNWQKIRDEIIAFRHFLNSIGENSKPAWLTEFGIANSVRQGKLVRGQQCPYINCLTPAEQYEEWRMVAEDFMLPLLDWLKSQTYIQKWFWYYSGQENSWNEGLNGVTDIFWRDVSGGPLYQALGTTYRDSAIHKLVYNADFETDGEGLYKYKFWTGGPGTDYFMLPDTTTRQGGFLRAAKVHVGQQPGIYGNVAVISQHLAATDLVGKYVRFSTYAKTSANGAAGLKITLNYANGTRDAGWTPSVVASRNLPEWTKISTNWVTIPANVVKIEIEGMANGAGVDVWFDDLSLEVTSSPPPTSTAIPGDANNDGKVDGIDYIAWLNHYSQHTSLGASVGDFNTPPDDVVDGVDYIIWLNHYTR